MTHGFTPPARADVVVIGGGPSGSMAAGLLAKKGFEVVLLEKVQHPRAIVGESVLPHFWRYTDQLGDATARVEKADFIRKAGGIVMWDGTMRRTKFESFGHKRPALHVDRETFDEALLRASAGCGAKVFERTAVTRVDLGEPEQNTVHWRSVDDGAQGTIAARYVVDASGQAAVVAKQLGFREFDEHLRFTALWGYYEGGRYLDYDGGIQPFSARRARSPVTLVSSIGGWGWAWQIVLREKISVGIIVPPERMANLKATQGDLESRFQSLAAEVPGTGKLMEGATFIEGSAGAIRDYAYKPVKLAVGDCYLVGDSAAFVDPINSSGITFGMYAAFAAAWAIEGSLGNKARRDRFRDHFEHEYRSRLDIFRLVAYPHRDPLPPAELERMAKALSSFSDAEKQLALSTTILTGRPERVQQVFARLNVREESIVDAIEVPAELRG